MCSAYTVSVTGLWFCAFSRSRCSFPCSTFISIFVERSARIRGHAPQHRRFVRGRAFVHVQSRDAGAGGRGRGLGGEPDHPVQPGPVARGHFSRLGAASAPVELCDDIDGGKPDIEPTARVMTSIHPLEILEKRLILLSLPDQKSVVTTDRHWLSHKGI